MVEISPAAAREIRRIKSNQHSDSPLRLMVKSGGCSGLFYDLKFAKEINQTESPTVTGDRLLKINDISLIIDRKSWKYLEHLKLDYAEDLMGGGFRFHNPNAHNTCGCGISFSEAK
ncbi:iron-sulfur cluster assembly accessory protein [Pleurocapsales cyanobacterium LEGE 10410]|nr:iron-sulfur cluster assembly accessory protein [Pleurocapsales cyanobacterium LEGE 10410]